MVPPGRIFPSRSAASIMEIPIRSFTDPPGLRYSSFARTRYGRPFVTLRSGRTGVCPIRSKIESGAPVATATGRGVAPKPLPPGDPTGADGPLLFGPHG